MAAVVCCPRKAMDKSQNHVSHNKPSIVFAVCLLQFEQISTMFKCFSNRADSGL